MNFFENIGFQSQPSEFFFSSFLVGRVMWFVAGRGICGDGGVWGCVEWMWSGGKGGGEGEWVMDESPWATVECNKQSVHRFFSNHGFLRRCRKTSLIP